MQQEYDDGTRIRIKQKINRRKMLTKSQSFKEKKKELQRICFFFFRVVPRILKKSGIVRCHYTQEMKFYPFQLEEYIKLCEALSTGIVGFNKIKCNVDRQFFNHENKKNLKNRKIIVLESMTYMYVTYVVYDVHSYNTHIFTQNTFYIITYFTEQPHRTGFYVE